MSQHRRSSYLYGPRPVSSCRRSSSSSTSSMDSVQEPSSNPSNDLSLSTSATSSATSYSSFLVLSDRYEASDSSMSDAELKLKLHTGRPQRRESPGPRPLPPIPQHTNRPLLSLDISLSADSTQKSRPRWLPVPPLPMSPFPTIAPTACSSPATSLPPPMEYLHFDEEIDWCMIDEIVTSFNS